MQLAHPEKLVPVILTSFQSKAKDEDVFNVFNIKYECEGEIQIFLDEFSKATNNDLSSHFKNPVNFKTIQFETPADVKIEFDEIDDLSATLLSIKVARSYKNSTEKFTYVLSFSTSDFDNARLLSTYLNQKETDENGKKKSILFDFQISDIKPLMFT
jgi:hypothetical protein